MLKEDVLPMLRSCFSPLVLSLVALVSLSACSSMPESEASYPRTERERDRDRIGTVSGNDDGFILFGGQRSGRGERGGAGGAAGIGVNAHLWRASLDTISFMPLASADPFGGVILTDWSAVDGNANERFKVNVFIKDKTLRSDTLQVTVFKQTLDRGTWRDAPVSEDTALQLENAILTRARQLKNEAIL